MNKSKSILSKIYTRQYFPLFVTAIILILSFSGLAFLNRGELVTVNVSGVALRERPSTNSSSLATLEDDTVIQVTDEANGWYEVMLDGKTKGYLPIWLIEDDALTSDQNLSGEVINSTPLYTEGNIDSEIILQIEPGEYVDLNFEDSGWAQVSYMNHYGFIPTASLNLMHDEDVPQEVQDLIAQQEAQREYDEEFATQEQIIFVRQGNQSFLNQPNLWSDIIYTPEYNQRFELIEVIYDEYDESEFYFVEDEDGVRGYLETRITAQGSDYLDHIGTTDPGSIQNAVIVIDPGHGGEDPGAISSDQATLESEVALQTAQFLKDYLDDMGATVHLTRDDDYWVDLDERPEISNNVEADAFISLHYDASHDPDWHGTTTYYFHEADYGLAESINNQLQELPLPNNYVNFGNYLVLRENDRPSVLLELGYMSNDFDLGYIRDEEYLETAANAIAQGLVNYFGE